jgi:transposase
MLPVEEWAEIRRLHRVEGVSQRAIARRLDVARETVARALRRDGPPRYQRAPRGSKVDPFKERIAALLARHPGLSAVRCYELLAPEGYTGKQSILRAYLRTQRPKPVAFQRTEYVPGEVGQVDWAELPTKVPDAFGEPRTVYALLLVLGASRLLTGAFSFRMRLPDLLRCLAECLAFVGGVPRWLVFDNPKTVVLHHRRTPEGREVVWNPGFLAFADRYGFATHACTPGLKGAHEKGLVERPVHYLKHNFWAGRTFTSLEDVAAQFTAWRDGTANVRLHTTLRERPLDRFTRPGGDCETLLPLPAELYAGVEVRWARVSRQGHVRVETSDYTVPAVLAGQQVEVHLAAGTVRVLSGNRLVAEHPRSLGRYRLVQDPAHLARPWAVGALETGSSARSVPSAPSAPFASTPLGLPPLPASAHVAVQLADLSRYAALVDPTPGFSPGGSRT